VEIKPGGGRRIKSEMAVFKKAKKLISFCYDVTDNWPKKYQYDFTAKVRNITINILEKLIEANKIFIQNNKQKNTFIGEMVMAIRITKRSDLQNEVFAEIEKLNYFFFEAYSMHLINLKKWQYVSGLLFDITNLLKAWIISDYKRYKFMG